MSTGRRFIVMTGLFLLAVSLVALVQTTRAVAQCGTPERSTCFTCHEVQDPVLQKGEWHTIHAGKDLCVSCHGGNGTVADAAGAHQGMVAQPLSDIYTDCHACHPDYESRAERFAAQIGVTPGSCATPTVAPVQAAGGQPPSSNISLHSGLVDPPAGQIAVGWLALAMALILVFSGTAYRLGQHRSAH